MSGCSPDTDAETIQIETEECLHTHIEEMKTIHNVLLRHYHRKGPIMVTLTRPWRRFKTPPLTDAVMKMSRRNYIVYDDIYTSRMRTIRTCDVLHTGAGLNFVCRSHLQRTNVHIKSGMNPFISDANSCALNIVGTTTIFVRFVSYEVKVNL